MEIELLWFEGCPNSAEARARLHDTIHDLEIEVDVRETQVRSPEDAVRLRFPGSPTIRVNGRDVDPLGESDLAFGMACRVYRTADGPQGAPPREMIRSAILGAAG